MPIFVYVQRIFVKMHYERDGCCTALTGADCRRGGHDLLAGPARSNCIPSILCLPKIPFSGFHQCNIVTLRSKLTTMSIRQGQVKAHRLRQFGDTWPCAHNSGIQTPYRLLANRALLVSRGFEIIFNVEPCQTLIAVPTTKVPSCHKAPPAATTVGTVGQDRCT
jgi:hypothetical protein